MDVERLQRGAAWLLTAVSAAAFSSFAGCTSTGKGVAALRPLDEPAQIDGIMGPTERRLHAASWEQRRRQLQDSGLNVEGLAEFDAAQRFYDAGEYRAAENAFQALAKQRARAGKTFPDRIKDLLAKEQVAATGLFGSYGDPIEEDALFMVAECQFARQRYSWAQDSYGTLLEKYPSTRHLDNVTRRMFFIAQTWLGVPPTTAKVNDVQLVEHSDAGDPEPTLESAGGAGSWPIVPNFVDRTRPVFDTHGRALQALESIWRHDAAGPLADDALMLQATYFQRKGDYVEAARLYKLVREQYPDSPHFQNAFLLGSHVSLASYDGAEYEGGPLVESRQLKETSRQLFANLTDEQKQRLDAELQAIRNAEVEREWSKVEFYLRKQQPTSVALHCNRILHKYPDSSYAERAWDTLQQIQPKLTPEEAQLFVASVQRPNRNTAGSTAESGRAAIDSTAPPAEEDAGPPSGEWWNTPAVPQRTDETPELQPVEPGSSFDPPARVTL
jgi:outer membrane protein assembly factor BamD (BamD/ComL family)